LRNIDPRVKIGLCRKGLRAVLLLEDGSTYHGCGFGAERTVVGEVVFTTSMVGYPESLTDPSYAGQILIITHPLVGNYGVARRDLSIYGVPLHFESDRVWVSGFVIHELTEPSHWSSIMSLDEWLKRENVPGIYRVDTRALVKKIRERGVMMGVLKVYDPKEEEPNIDELWRLLERAPRYDQVRFVDIVSPKEVIIHEPENPELTIGIVDCGVKYGIVRELLKRRCRVVRYPPKTDPTKIVEECDGVIVSNGPGNPSILKDVIENVKTLVEYDVPMLGICLGHQLISLSLGASTFKLKYGHRGPNKTVKDLETGRCYITTQNHGYAVDPESAKKAGFKIWFINVDDKTVEGLKHVKKRIITTQFHPEAGPGPHDTSWIFDLFIKMMKAQ